MLSKEEIEKNMWKPKILGIFSEEEREQITKRGIEESKKCLNETIQNTYAERKAIKLENLKKYIEQLEFENKAYKAEHNHNITKIDQLESDKQKLIEKLEKDIVNITKTMQDGKHCDDYSRCRLKAYRTKTKEILEILK